MMMMMMEKSLCNPSTASHHYDELSQMLIREELDSGSVSCCVQQQWSERTPRGKPLVHTEGANDGPMNRRLDGWVVIQWDPCTVGF